MKELSIIQKAQKYDEAIAYAKKLLKTIGNATLGNLVLKNEFERMFPELAESEDEEIRKEMLQIAKKSEDSFYMAMTPNKREKLIAWLEKQDEKPKKVSIWKHWKNGIAGNGDGKLIYLVKDGYSYRFSSCLGFECDYIELSELDKLLSEKQGEKNLDDKVETKFKVGDWIVYKDNVWKVCNISLRRYYELLNINNEVIIRHNEGVDKTAHLWTIQDAKDGDVLVCKGDIKNSNGIKYERICLFKNLDNAFFTLTKTSNYVEEYDIDVNIDYPDNTVPATKEQKEILFMAMKEAGYEWGAEKKKLKKIADKVEPKFKVGDWCIDNEDGTIFQIVKVLDNTYTYKTNEGKEYSCTHYSLENDARLWTIQDAKDGDVLASKDGDDILIFRNLDGNKSFSSYYSIRRKKEIGWHNGWCYGSFIPATKEQCDALMKVMTEAGYTFDFEKKELKKIEQKTAWSEEDELKRNTLIDVIKKQKGSAIFEGLLPEELTDWLKLLKDRVQPQNFTITDEELAQAKCFAYNDALGKIEWRNGEPTFDDGWSAAIDYIRKKSLKYEYTWKPSEGQLECLGYAIEKAEKDYSPLINNRIYLTLKALKEELEKL